MKKKTDAPATEEEDPIDQLISMRALSKDWGSLYPQIT